MDTQKPASLREAMTNADTAAKLQQDVMKRREEIANKPSNRLDVYQSQVGKAIDQHKASMIQIEAEYDTLRTSMSLEMDMHIDNIEDEALKYERLALEKRKQIEAMEIAKKEKLAEMMTEHKKEKKALQRIIKAHKAMQLALGEVEDDGPAA